MTILFRTRQSINDTAWNACVASSPNRLVYGYSWYLDAVTSLPDWSWAGLVVLDEAMAYQAVMPIPLRRKWGRWVVHQPFFCQMLGIFSENQLEPEPFFRHLQSRFRYGSLLHVRQVLDTSLLQLNLRQLQTHTLDLSVPYESISHHYSRDRRLNLRRSLAANWHLTDADDPEPLIHLFQANHAARIPTGVADWAYVLFRRLVIELQQRDLATLRYALHDGQIQAGALFVREGNRIIYLFNAASESGRRGNARTLLLDRMIRENAGQPGLLLDFESPEKPSIARFYQSFGATTETFYEIRYSRLTWLERQVQALGRIIAAK